MASTNCPNCGNPLPENGRFCGQCGATVPSAPPPAMTPGPASVDLSRTVATDMQVAPPTDPMPTQKTAKRTMIGVSAAELVASSASMPASQPVSAPIPTAPMDAPIAATPNAGRGISAKTMLGVAVPGVAAAPNPMHAPTAPAPALQATPAPNMGRGAAAKTMLGVAIPGIAPAQSEPPPPNVPNAPPPQASEAAAFANRPRFANATAIMHVDVLPKPAPLPVQEEIAPPPSIQKRGFPVAIVLGVVTALVVLLGAVILFVWKGTPPITGQPRTDDATGNDLLHLRCESCADGTIVTLGPKSATFKSSEADLMLATPLHIGDNPLTLDINRPGIGRDELVKLVVPLAYRVVADVKGLNDSPPRVAVVVDAPPGSEAKIDDKPIALDPSGHGVAPIDIRADTEGANDQVKTIDRKIAYTVTPKGGQAKTGTVAFRAPVVPLHIDAPGTHAVIETADFLVAGQTSANAKVTINGNAYPVAADGQFVQRLPAQATGDTPVEIRVTSGTTNAPRTATYSVKRVDHLANEAKAIEATSPIGYDDIAQDIAAKVGQETIVDGDVVESKVIAHQTLMIVNDKRGCKKGPCLIRVVHGNEDTIGHERVRAYGRVTKPFATQSGVIPEVEADFILTGRR